MTSVTAVFRNPQRFVVFVSLAFDIRSARRSDESRLAEGNARHWNPVIASTTVVPWQEDVNSCDSTLYEQDLLTFQVQAYSITLGSTLLSLWHAYHSVTLLQGASCRGNQPRSPPRLLLNAGMAEARISPIVFRNICTRTLLLAGRRLSPAQSTRAR